MPEIDPSLSISDALDAGMAAIKEGDTPGSGEDNPDDGGDNPSEDDPENPSNNGDDPNSDPADPQKKTEDQPKPGDKKPEEDKDKGGKKEPDVDPEKGKYEGEYTKERFDGLMSKWQKDRQALSRIPELERQIAELKGSPNGPSKPGSKDQDDEIEYPPELQNADEETKQGYRLLVKGLGGKFLTEDKVKAIVEDVVTRPQREAAATQTKVQAEIEDLSVEYGKEFADNQKEVLKFAGDRGYQLGSLRQAYLAWKDVQALQAQITKLQGGKKTVKEIEEEKKKDAGIPSSTNRKDVVPVFDPERDGNKSFDEIMEEAKKHI